MKAQLKWFLVGFVVCLFLTDWVKVRSQMPGLRTLAQTGEDDVVAEEKVSDSCLTTLKTVHDDLDRDETRANLALMSRLRLVQDLKRKNPNDTRLASLLALIEQEQEEHGDAEAGEGKVDLSARQTRGRHP